MIRKKTLSHTCGVPAPFAKGAKRRGQAPARHPAAAGIRTARRGRSEGGAISFGRPGPSGPEGGPAIHLISGAGSSPKTPSSASPVKRGSGGKAPVGPCPPGPTPGGALVPLPPRAKGPAARRRRKPSLPLPPRYARHLPHRGRLRRPTGPPHPTEGRRGQRPLRKLSGPPVGPSKGRPLPSQIPPFVIRAAARVPSTQYKNRPGVGRFHTFFGNYSTNLSHFKKAPLSWTQYR